MVRFMPGAFVAGKSSDHTGVIATSRCNQTFPALNIRPIGSVDKPSQKTT
jgi:hypothetical protein